MLVRQVPRGLQHPQGASERNVSTNSSGSGSSNSGGNSLLSGRSEARVDTFGGPFFGKHKWLGAVADRQGSIYGVPSNIMQVLKITPPSTQQSLDNPELPQVELIGAVDGKK